MAGGLTATLIPQSNFVVSHQLRMGSRCHWQAGSNNTKQLSRFVSVLLYVLRLRRRTAAMCPLQDC